MQTHDEKAVVMEQVIINYNLTYPAITREWGYEPVAVEDGEVAWQMMQENAPHD